MQKILITGSAGLIGSEAVRFFAEKNFQVFGIDNNADNTGIDNNMRSYFFGKEASITWNKKLLEKLYKNYTHISIDIRNKKKIAELFKHRRFDLIIHTAAQPSHDWATKEPLTDFTINANGTLILLECFRQYSPEAVFIFTSTNKVYGDTPNTLPLKELKSRYEIAKTHTYFNGIDESMSVDRSKHSLFGASKLAADILVQEYGKYFNLHTTVFRAGCLTGPAHSATQLHGFLAYLVKSILLEKSYTVFGYKGKQVRDNMHAYDLVHAFYHVYKNPKKGEVYNIGGSRHSHISILEAVEKIEAITGKKAVIRYEKKPRMGDHIWYISNISKFRSHYPKWEYTYTIDIILKELCMK